MTRLIVCDMDGTLVCMDGRLPADFKCTYGEMRKKGIFFAVASGRPYAALYEILSPYGEDIIYISENGAYTRYKDAVLYKRTFNTGVIHRFASWFNDRERGFLAACGLKCYYIIDDVSYFLNSLSAFRINYSLTESFDGLDDEIFQLTVFFPDGVKNVSEIPLYKELGGSFEFVATHTHWMDIYPKDVNKGVGLEAVYRSFGIKPQETVAFGDFYNDIPMFLKSGCSYCPETAPDEVKTHADHTICGESGYAVTRAIMRIISGCGDC